MKNIFAKIGFTTVILLFLFLFSIRQAEADDTEEVECPEDSIQEELDDAEDGDAIEVEGNCSENITISKNGITLRGPP